MASALRSRWEAYRALCATSSPRGEKVPDGEKERGDTLDAGEKEALEMVSEGLMLISGVLGGKMARALEEVKTGKG